MLSEEKFPTEEEISSIKNTLAIAKNLISNIESARKSKVLVFYCHQIISQPVAYKISKILRQMEPIDSLDLFLESGGGDINAAYKILKMFKFYAKQTRIIVPFFAKSAASLIAIGGNELTMCRTSELGPIDPQVVDPSSGLLIPAHSIKEAIKFIEDTTDPLVKLSLADKIPPLLMGAFREAAESTKQYLDEILDKLGDKKNDAMHAFTERFLSHGYPMDREFLKSVGINVCNPDSDMENMFCNLHQTYADLYHAIYNNHPRLQLDVLLIQSKVGYSVSFGGFDITPRLNALDNAQIYQDSTLKTDKNQPQDPIRES